MDATYRKDYDNIRERGEASCAPWDFVARQIRRLGSVQRSVVLLTSEPTAKPPAEDEIDRYLSEYETAYRAEYTRRNCHRRR
jgi:hypothetical protein